MKIENRQRFLAILAIGGIALLASDKLIISPLTTSWKERSTRIAEPGCGAWIRYCYSPPWR